MPPHLTTTNLHSSPRPFSHLIISPIPILISWSLYTTRSRDKIDSTNPLSLSLSQLEWTVEYHPSTPCSHRHRHQSTNGSLASTSDATPFNPPQLFSVAGGPFFLSPLQRRIHPSRPLFPRRCTPHRPRVPLLFILRYISSSPSPSLDLCINMCVYIYIAAR